MSEQRFTIASAESGAWSAYPRLAAACEDAALTVTQADAARYVADGLTAGQVGVALGLEYQNARGVVRKASRKLSQSLLGARSRRYWGEILDCYRNRREKGRSPAALVGVMVRRLPYVYDQDAPTAERRRRREDPRNYTNVSMRGAAVDADDLAPEAISGPMLLLQEICGWLEPGCRTHRRAELLG